MPALRLEALNAGRGPVSCLPNQQDPPITAAARQQTVLKVPDGSLGGQSRSAARCSHLASGLLVHLLLPTTHRQPTYIPR